MADKYFKLTQSGQQVQNLLNQIPSLAPLASPALTGAPTAPTQALSDSSTKIATTKFVDDFVDGEITAYDATIAPQISAKQNAAVTATATLAAVSWVGGSQTVTVSSVTATNIVFVAPAPSSQLDYEDAQIICTTQGTNSLTFTCQKTPSADISVNVVIL